MNDRVKMSAQPETRRFHPFGFFYGLIVGGVIGSAMGSATGEVAGVGVGALLGALVGASGGQLLVSKLKPNRTMING